MNQRNATTNRNAVIRARADRTGKYRTETYGRDDGSTQFSATTNPRSNSTQVFIDLPEVSLKLTGSQARTLYRLLAKHYLFAGKSY